MTMHRYTLVRLQGSTVARLDYIGPPSGLPEGWAIHKRSAAL
jgi:hypothetical protein